MNAWVCRRTAAGPGAVAVLTVTGSDARDGVAALAPGFRGRPGRPELVRLRSGGELLDEALGLALAAERIELHLHGSPAVVSAVIGALEAVGVSTVDRSPRSLEQRAERAVVHARTEVGALTLLDQARGALREAVDRAVLRSPAACGAELGTLARVADGAAAALRVPRVVLYGPVNAGKSTLFNLLVGSERAVVSPEPGTTRDAVFEEVWIRGHPVELVDLAGERELPEDAVAGGQASVESAGQRLSRELVAGADLVLLVAPDGTALTAPAPGRNLRVHTFAGKATAPQTSTADEPRLDAACDPIGARERLEAALIHALGIDPSAYRPGQAVPFEAEQLELLDRIGRTVRTSERRRMWIASAGSRWPLEPIGR